MTSDIGKGPGPGGLAWYTAGSRTILLALEGQEMISVLGHQQHCQGWLEFQAGKNEGVAKASY